MSDSDEVRDRFFDPYQTNMPKRLRRPLARIGRNDKRAYLKERDEWIAQQLAKEEGDQ